jgi:response regulator NasT
MANLVIVNDESPAWRQLKGTLARIGHVVVGEASGGERALALARSLRPDAVILDVGPRSEVLLSLARTLARERLAAVVVLAGGENDPPGAALAQRVSEAGVLALVRKPARSEDLEPALAIAVSRFREIAALETQVRTLTERMEARQLVGRAKALLMERQNLSEREAFTRIQSQSQALNKPAHEIARAIILASEMAPPPALNPTSDGADAA